MQVFAREFGAELIEDFLREMEDEAFPPRNGAGQEAVNPPAPPAPAQEELRRAYEETVDPMFDRYDEEDWL